MQDEQIKHVLESFAHAFITVCISDFLLKGMKMKLGISRVLDVIIVNQNSSPDHKSAIKFSMNTVNHKLEVFYSTL